ncbi:MAG: hypothetical protein JW733_03565 [Coriobacteriia bacterium]|nr:hypothetical protein [Coriobacteriia bacterium]MBN2840793.1 hypothetical protein [Coriobacteriia bacterium]
MSLERALSRLELDSPAERALRDVLILFKHHPGESLSERDVAVRTGRMAEEIGPLLAALASAFVLDFDGESGGYRFAGDVVVGYEIEAFRRRIDSRQSHVTSNVARFRERQGF